MDNLDKKVERAIKLLKAIPSDDIEIAFSGGKDSSVILSLAKMAGIKFTAIYKNTTIDPSGNIAFCKSQGCEIRQPSKSFFQLIRENGFPTRRVRFCCRVLKEYKVKDDCVLGVRKAESVARAKRYEEPQICRVYGNGGNAKKDRSNVQRQYFPIMDWTNDDIKDFIKKYNVVVNPLYYNDKDYSYLIFSNYAIEIVNGYLYVYKTKYNEEEENDGPNSIVYRTWRVDPFRGILREASRRVNHRSERLYNNSMFIEVFKTKI